VRGELAFPLLTVDDLEAKSPRTAREYDNRLRQILLCLLEEEGFARFGGRKCSYFIDRSA
jgi:hypothetical protein